MTTPGVDAALAELDEDFRDEIEVDKPEVDEPSEEDQKLEERARRMGWRPKSEYGGNPDRWVDAATFLARGEQELPILRERLRKFDSNLASTEQRLAKTEKELTEANSRIKDQTNVLTELRDMSRASEERGYLRAKRELTEREVKAVREADEPTYRQIQQEREALEATRPKPAAAPVVEDKKPDEPPPQARPNPVVDEWIGQNPWYGKDQLLTLFAMESDRDIEAQHPGWTLTDKLAEVKKRVMDKFPEKFDNPRRERPAAVATSSAPAPKSKGKTVKDLPRDAREALAKYKREIPGYTDEEYLALYDWG